ncbi:MAG: type II secretion system minor pseudopilin GspK [Hyphomonas sp.]
MIPDNKQAGAALLSILLIVATLSIAALMATEAIARQTELQKLGARRAIAAWAARSAEAAALASVNDLVGASRLPATGESEDRTHVVALPLDGGQIILSLKELPPCFNLNTLGHPDEAVRDRQAAILALLLEDLGAPRSDTSSLIAMVSDWIDGDSDTRPGGAEDAFYLARQNGYRAANQPLQSLAELEALPGFTPQLRAAIAGSVCVIPSTEPLELNLNALTLESAPLLRATTHGVLSLTETRRFIESRPASGWNSIEDVRAYAARRGALEDALSDLPMAVQGSHFIADGTAALDTGSWGFDFLLRANATNPPEIVWRSMGGVT